MKYQDFQSIFFGEQEYDLMDYIYSDSPIKLKTRTRKRHKSVVNFNKKMKLKNENNNKFDQMLADIDLFNKKLDEELETKIGAKPTVKRRRTQIETEKPRKIQKTLRFQYSNEIEIIDLTN